MANDLVFRITAVDAATKVAKNIESSFAKITGPISKVTKRLASAGKVGTKAFAKLDASMNAVAQSARTVSDRVASIIPGMTALTGLASVAGVGALAERWGNFGFTLARTSRQLGMSAQSLQAWHYAAQRAGVTAEQFDQSMVSSQNTIREAAFGANPQAMMLMSRLGVQISRGKDGQIDYQKTQQDLLAALGKVKNPAGQRTAADALGLGALLPMVQRGTYNSDRQQAIANGYAPSDDAIQRAAGFRDRLNDLKSSAEALANTIGDKLVPVLTPMVEKISNWLSENRVDIATRFADAVGKFTAWINSVDWAGWYERVNKIADAFGGWGNVLRDIVALKIAGVFLGWSGALVGLIANLKVATTSMAALRGAAAVGAAGEAGAAAAGTIGLVPALGATALAAGVVAAPFAIAGSAVYAKMTQTEEGIKQRIADREARIKELDQLIQLDGGNAAGVARYTAERAELQKGVDEWKAKLQVVQAAANSKDPLGIRTNNPLNIQPNGQQNIYASPEEGLGAAASLLRRKYSGLTLAEIAEKWTGGAAAGATPAERGNYVRILERATGLTANQRPDLSNPTMLSALIKGQVKAENGQQPYSDDQIAAGIRIADGAAAPPPGALAAAGSEDSHDRLVDALSTALQRAPLNLNVTAPVGTRVDTDDQRAARINHAMPAGNLP